MNESAEIVVPQLFTFSELAATVLKLLWTWRSVFVLMIIGGVIMFVTNTKLKNKEEANRRRRSNRR